MTIVKAAAFCPGCKYELPGPVEVCPKCGRVLRVPKSEFFELPLYISEQMRDYAGEVDDRVNNNKPLSPGDVEKFEKIKKEYDSWVRLIPADSKLAALIDAQHMLRHILHSKVDSQHLQDIIGRGMAIGRLAESLNSYVKSGGALSDPETRFVPADTGDTGRSATATFRGGDSSGFDPE